MRHWDRLMNKIFNFSAGPAMMPPEVMKQAQAEFLNWNNLGVSVAEISHRSQPFLDLVKEIEKDLRDLLKIPANYHVLFLSGGSRTQFAAVPMNLCDDFKSAAYVLTGHWGKVAATEAARFINTKIVASSESAHYTFIPPEKTWENFSDCAYLHYFYNKTIHGVEFDFIPDAKNIPLVCDMSSNFLSRPFDVSKFGLIYACSQKDIGISGITIVIIRDDLLKRKPHSFLPAMMNYDLQVQNNSMYNTPPTYSWYFAGLIFQWLKKQGGLNVIAKRNAEKSAKLYDYLDSQTFYKNNVDKKCRSQMNIIFKLPTPELDDQFAKAASAAGFMGLKGHKVLGGIRASIYNAMPMEGIDALISFMKEFAKKNG